MSLLVYIGRRKLSDRIWGLYLCPCQYIQGGEEFPTEFRGSVFMSLLVYIGRRRVSDRILGPGYVSICVCFTIYKVAKSFRQNFGPGYVCILCLLYYIQDGEEFPTEFWVCLFLTLSLIYRVAKSLRQNLRDFRPLLK